MKQLLIIILLIFVIHVQPTMPQLIFDKAEYKSRREKLMDRIPDGIAIIRGASMPVGSAHFHQYNNLMYFAGVDIPDVILIIDGIKRESTLFFTIPEHTADEGAIPLDLVRDPVAVTGIENYLPLEDFTSALTKRLIQRPLVYTPFSSEEGIAENSMEKFRLIERSMTNDEWDGRLSREMQFVQKLNEKFPDIEVKNCTPDIWTLRKIKSSAEIDIMREAARVGVNAHKAVMEATRPGQPEKALAALFEYSCMLMLLRAWHSIPLSCLRSTMHMVIMPSMTAFLKMVILLFSMPGRTCTTMIRIFPPLSRPMESFRKSNAKFMILLTTSDKFV